MTEGRDLVTPVPLERWDLDHLDAPQEVLDSNMLRFGAFAADVAAFDATGFRLARAEAAAMDLQARALLQAVADARQVRICNISHQAVQCSLTNDLHNNPSEFILCMQGMSCKRKMCFSGSEMNCTVTDKEAILMP